MSSPQRRCSGCHGYFAEDQMSAKKTSRGNRVFRCATCTKGACAPQAVRDAFGRKTRERNEAEKRDNLRRVKVSTPGFKGE